MIKSFEALLLTSQVTWLIYDCLVRCLKQVIKAHFSPWTLFYKRAPVHKFLVTKGASTFSKKT